MPDVNSMVAAEVDRINATVTGIVEGDDIPQETASALAAQSMAQSLAIATADAAALLRHVETTMSAVQAAAFTRWVETGPGEADPHYQVIVRAAAQVIADSVGLWRDINVAAQQLLSSLPGQSPQAEGIVVEAQPVATPVTKPAKARARKKVAKVAKKAAKPQPKAKTKAAKKAANGKGKKKPAAKPVPTPVPEAAASGE